MPVYHFETLCPGVTIQPPTQVYGGGAEPMLMALGNLSPQANEHVGPDFRRPDELMIERGLRAFLPSVYQTIMSVESVCVSVCLAVHLSVCVSVQAITLELLEVGASSLVHAYIFTISRSSLSTKVIGSRSRSNQ